MRPTQVNVTTMPFRHLPADAGVVRWRAAAIADGNAANVAMECACTTIDSLGVFRMGNLRQINTIGRGRFF